MHRRSGVHAAADDDAASSSGDDFSRDDFVRDSLDAPGMPRSSTNATPALSAELAQLSALEARLTAAVAQQSRLLADFTARLVRARRGARDGPAAQGADACRA